MTDPRLRPSRAHRVLCRAAAFALVLSLPCAPALWASALAAGTRSHTHHATSAPLPASSFVETGTRVPKHHKAGAPAGNGHVSEHRGGSAASHGASQGRGGSKSRHGHPAEPVDDAVPMYRAGHSTGHLGTHGAGYSAGHSAGRRDAYAEEPMYARREPASRHGRHGGRGQDADTMVAEVSGVAPNGDYTVRLHGHGKAAPGRVGYGQAWAGRGHAEAPAVMASAHGGRVPYPGHASAPSAMASGVSHAPAMAAARGAAALPNGAYAEGYAHPDNDDRMPRGQALAASAGTSALGSTSASGARIGTAEVMAAPVRPLPATPAPASPVVQGFGSEVAVPSAEPSTRPGGTRRRNHPSAATIAEEAAPHTLEDREAVTDAVMTPTVLPAIYDRSGHVVMPAPLKGSREVLVHQNTMATSDGLERIQDDSELNMLRAQHLLVNFPESASLHVNSDLPLNRRCARPWTVMFAEDLARDFSARFHEPIYVTSAVRTVSFQMRLQRVNGNAAAIDGDGASPHLTGQAIDFGKRGMSAAELAWMRAYLLPLMQAGKIDVEEEFQQACFHVSVYRRYGFGRPVHELAQASGGANRPTTDAAPEMAPDENR